MVSEADTPIHPLSSFNVKVNVSVNNLQCTSDKPETRGKRTRMDRMGGEAHKSASRDVACQGCTWSRVSLEDRVWSPWQAPHVQVRTDLNVLRRVCRGGLQLFVREDGGHISWRHGESIALRQWLGRGWTGAWVIGFTLYGGICLKQFAGSHTVLCCAVLLHLLCPALQWLGQCG